MKCSMLFFVFCFFLEYRGSRKWNGGKLVLQALRSASSGNLSLAKPGYYTFTIIDIQF